MERDKMEQENVQEALHEHDVKLKSGFDSTESDGFGGDELFDDDVKSEDYHAFTKPQFVTLIKDLSKSEDHKQTDTILREIKPIFDSIREKERAEALLRFIASGASEEDFEYKGDEFDIAFDAHHKLIKDRRTQYIKQQELSKADNLRRKEEILEKLRELADSQDASSNQFETFKELQREWKSIGQVPGPQAKTLWANYHALVDRYYDNQSIYFELKELDRKRNLEAKVELCVRAEKLQHVEIIKDAIRELNELHHEFKHLGPVPLEDKENVWQRFKAASDAVYLRRDSFVENLQKELHVNLDAKAQLGAELLEFANFQSDRIKEWNQKTKEILDIQKKWELIGGVPRTKAKEINKKFWSAFKQFFNNKGSFFRKLDEEREKNLQIKNDLLKKAVELKDSLEWDAVSNELKSLQQKWKEVGPVPEKHRERIFKEFKDACDHFFEQKRVQHGKAELDQEENLKAKESICSEMEKHITDGTALVETLRELQEKYNAIGFVPRKDINTIRARYSDIVEKYMNAIPGFSEDDKSRLVLENQLSNLKNDPMADRKIHQKEQAIRKKISKVENDIALWRNNLEFFGRSQNAEKYKEEFNEKIKTASEHLAELKKQLKVLRAVSS